jgi:hypothetical protein
MGVANRAAFGLFFCLTVSAALPADPAVDSGHFAASPAASGHPIAPAALAQPSPVVFPCLDEIKRRPSLPALKLFGEIHTDAADLARDQAIIQGVGRGTYLLGLESRLYDDHQDPWIWQKTPSGQWWKSPVYGLDDAFPRAVASIPANYFSLVNTLESQPPRPAAVDGIKREILAELVILDYDQEAWQLARPRLQSEGAKNLATYIDRLLTKKGNAQQWQASIQRIQRDAIWENNDAFVEVQKQLAVAFLRLLETKYAQQPLPNLKWYRNVLTDPQNLAKRRSFVAEIAVRYRNEAAFARNLARSYCDAVRLGKPFYAITGQSHLAELRALLAQASGGKVNAELVPSLTLRAKP